MILQFVSEICTKKPKNVFNYDITYFPLALKFCTFFGSKTASLVIFNQLKRWNRQFTFFYFSSSTSATCQVVLFWIKLYKMCTSVWKTLLRCITIISPTPTMQAQYFKLSNSNLTKLRLFWPSKLKKINFFDNKQGPYVHIRWLRWAHVFYCQAAAISQEVLI